MKDRRAFAVWIVIVGVAVFLALVSLGVLVDQDGDQGPFIDDQEQPDPTDLLPPARGG